MRFADIACGSGSFLLGVYDLLLRWHTAYYAQNPEAAKRDGCIQLDSKVGGAVSFRLSLKQRRAILERNIWGADIDAQAVEVSKLSLYLKLLEDETANSTRQFQLLDQERVLPNLDKNIVCGNSLVDFDINEAGNLSREAEAKINPMDWKAEFPFLSKESGKFDAIIGNPPYLFITELDKTNKDYFSSKYKTASYRYDIYGLFIEKSIDELLKLNGGIGVIIPHTLLNNDSFQPLREFILEESKLISIVDIGPGVFQSAKNETMLLFLENGRPNAESLCKVIRTDKTLRGLNPDEIADEQNILQSLFATLPKSAFLVSMDAGSMALAAKLRSIPMKLGELCTINQGLRTGDNEKYLSPVQTLKSHRPGLGGKNIQRFAYRSDFFVQYERAKMDAPRREEIFTSSEKIVVQEIRNITLKRRIVAAYDDQQHYCLQSTNVINKREKVNADLKFLLGLLNSELLNWFFRVSFPSNNHIASNQLAQMPIRAIDLSDAADKKSHDDLVSLVEQMLAAKRDGATSQSEAETRRAAAKIASLDRRIDALVYALYGLSEDEIALVEG